MAWYCMRARSGPSPAASRVSSFVYCCSPGTISSLMDASGFSFSKRWTSPRKPFCSPLVLAHVWNVSCPEPEPAPPPAPPPHPPGTPAPHLLRHLRPRILYGSILGSYLGPRAYFLSSFPRPNTLLPQLSALLLIR